MEFGGPRDWMQLLQDVVFNPVVVVHLGSWILVHQTKYFVVKGALEVANQLRQIKGRPITVEMCPHPRSLLVAGYAAVVTGFMAFWVFTPDITPSLTLRQDVVFNGLLNPVIMWIVIEVLKVFGVTRGIADKLTFTDEPTKTIQAVVASAPAKDGDNVR